tara:strand:- start:293 stop:487 length:195 start_codon:yes stop_codon:yes gene_type:complete
MREEVSRRRQMERTGEIARERASEEKYEGQIDQDPRRLGNNVIRPATIRPATIDPRSTILPTIL